MMAEGKKASKEVAFGAWWVTNIEIGLEKWACAIQN